MSEEQQGSLANTVNELPWWVKAVVVVGNTFGFPVIMLAYYLAQDAGVINNPVEERLRAIEGQQQEMKGVIVQGNATNKEIIQALKDQSQQRQMRCVIKAKTEDEKRACFPSKKSDD